VRSFASGDDRFCQSISGKLRLVLVVMLGQIRSGYIKLDQRISV